MKRTHWHDEERGRTRTITRLGRGVAVRRRAGEVELDELPPERAARSAPELPAVVRERMAQAHEKRARLLEDLERQPTRFTRRAIEALIQRGALDFLAEE